MVCLEDGSAWAAPLPCNPNSSPAFSVDCLNADGNPISPCSMAVQAGGQTEGRLRINNHDPYRTIETRLEAYRSASGGYPPGPPEWASIPSPLVVVPPLSGVVVPFTVAVPDDTAPDEYRLRMRAVLLGYSANGGGVSFSLAMGKSVYVQVF